MGGAGPLERAVCVCMRVCAHVRAHVCVCVDHDWQQSN